MRTEVTRKQKDLVGVDGDRGEKLFHGTLQRVGLWMRQGTEPVFPSSADHASAINESETSGYESRQYLTEARRVLDHLVGLSFLVL